MGTAAQMKLPEKMADLSSKICCLTGKENNLMCETQTLRMLTQN